MRLVHYKEGKIGIAKHASGRNTIAIVDEPGRKWIHILLLDGDNIEVRKVLLDEQEFMVDVESIPRIKLTPLQSVAKQWIKRNTSAQARAILKKAAA